MEMSSQLSPSVSPVDPYNDHELLFSDDPKFALHGEILMLVIVLLFITIFTVFIFFLYKKYRHGRPKLGEGELVLSKSTTQPALMLKGQIEEDRNGYNLFAGTI